MGTNQRTKRKNNSKQTKLRKSALFTQMTRKGIALNRKLLDSNCPTSVKHHGGKLFFYPPTSTCKEASSYILLHPLLEWYQRKLNGEPGLMPQIDCISRSLVKPYTLSLASSHFPLCIFEAAWESWAFLL